MEYVAERCEANKKFRYIIEEGTTCTTNTNRNASELIALRQRLVKKSN